jgi:outer membrane protein assembly factor BamA
VQFPSEIVRVTCGAIALLIVVFAPAASAQIPSDLSGEPIVHIDLAGPGASAIEARELGIPLGARISRRLLRSAISRLVGSGRFRDVQFDIEPTDGGVRLVAYLTPRLLVERIDVLENDVLGDDEVLEALELTRGSELLPEELDAHAARVENVYREHGYEGARADIEIRETNDPGRRVLVLRMNEGRPTPIAAVLFEGEEPPPESQALDAFDLEPGDVLDRTLVEVGIRDAELRMRERGWLEADIREPEYRRTDQGMEVILPAHVGPRYTIEVRGFEPLTRSTVEDVLELGDDRLTPGTLASIRERVVDLYQRYGFIDADAAVVVANTAREGEAVLRVAIEPGANLRVIAVSFPGARHFETQFLRDQIYSYLAEQLPGARIVDPVDTETADAIGLGGSPRARREVPAPFVPEPEAVYYESTYAEAIRHIRELYEADGFLSAELGEPEVVRLEGDRAVVQIAVREGPRTHLHRMTVTGNRVLLARDILVAAALERDMPFSRGGLDEAVDRIEEAYADLGYYYARAEPTVRFSEDRTRAEVMLEIVESYRVRVGSIVVRGNTLTDEALVRQRLSFAAGDLYRPALVRESEESLLELGIFSAVAIAPEAPDVPARVKPVIVTVSERKPQYIDGSLGVSTGQGFRGGFEYGYQNVFGYALALTLRAVASIQPVFFLDDVLAERFRPLSILELLERTVTASLHLPHLGMRNLGLSIDLVHLRDNERDFGLDNNGVGATLTWRPSRHFNMTLGSEIENNNVTLLIGGGLDEFLRNNTDPRLERLLRVPDGESTIVAFETTAALDFRDNPFDPSEGIFASASAEYAYSIFAEQQEDAPAFSSNFIKFAITGNAYIPIAEDWVFATEIRFGRVFHLDDRSKTYPNRAFRLGGVDTMRGYLQDALIPQDVAEQVAADPMLGPDDVVRAGDTFVLVRGELRFPLVGPFHGGVFADIGNLWADPTLIFEEFSLRPTVGLGLRLQTPVGPVAVDYGFILIRREALREPLGALHFSIGLF